MMRQVVITLKPTDMDALRRAHQHLEHPSLAIRLSNVVGTPIDVALQLLPKRWYKQLHRETESIIAKLLESSIATLPRDTSRQSRATFHHALAMMTGALGGFFGLPALLLELPVTTAIILRSIADIARRFGEELSDPKVRLACIEVFALGLDSHKENSAETAYYGVRFALALSVRGSIDRVASQGLARESGTLMANGIAKISSRFGVAISEKAAAQALPLLGAAGGAAVNTVFMRHFQDMAWSHFTMRRLERAYGPELVQAKYEELSREEELEKEVEATVANHMHTASTLKRQA